MTIDLCPLVLISNAIALTKKISIKRRDRLDANSASCFGRPGNNLADSFGHVHQSPQMNESIVVYLNLLRDS
jgi:hypothetical protein